MRTGPVPGATGPVPTLKPCLQIRSLGEPAGSTSKPGRFFLAGNRPVHGIINPSHHVHLSLLSLLMFFLEHSEQSNKSSSRVLSWTQWTKQQILFLLPQILLPNRKINLCMSHHYVLHLERFPFFYGALASMEYTWRSKKVAIHGHPAPADACNGVVLGHLWVRPGQARKHPQRLSSPRWRPWAHSRTPPPCQRWWRGGPAWRCPEAVYQ
jgi:hypothetical protein